MMSSSRVPQAGAAAALAAMQGYCTVSQASRAACMVTASCTVPSTGSRHGRCLAAAPTSPPSLAVAELHFLTRVLMQWRTDAQPSWTLQPCRRTAYHLETLATICSHSCCARSRDFPAACHPHPFPSRPLCPQAPLLLIKSNVASALGLV